MSNNFKINFQEINQYAVCGDGRTSKGSSFGFVFVMRPSVKWSFSPRKPASTEELNKIKDEIVDKMLEHCFVEKPSPNESF